MNARLSPRKPGGGHTWRFRAGRRACKPSHLAGSIAALLLSAAGVRAQTYTFPGTETFSDLQAWNFGAGPLPASSPALSVSLQHYQSSAFTAFNDSSLTLNSLNLAGYGSATMTVAPTLVGGFAFAGGAAKINNFGSGGTTQLSNPLALSEGLTSLTFDGAGGAPVQVSGTISSNSGAGAPLIIATDAANPLSGIVRLQGANSFLGGVQLNSGTLSLTNVRALGDRTNTLMVNGGALELLTTVSHSIVLNSTLSITSGAGGFISGALSGPGGLDVRPTGSLTETFSGLNTYSGPTSVGQTRLAVGTSAIPSMLRLNGAVGSINQTSSISVSDGMVFEINKNGGDSAVNSRVNASTPINVTGGFVQVLGVSGGFTTQTLGPLSGQGYTTVLASANAAATATNVTIANLVRPGVGVFVFSGENLGNAAAVAGARQANIFLTQVNGGTPASALVGGGGSQGSTSISILPWALGSLLNTSANFGAGTSFVTYGPNGVRPLDAVEYALNNFTTVQPNDNVRMTSGVVNPTTPKTINTLLFANNLTLNGGTNTVTITSGALASFAPNANIDSPVAFGPGGGGEAIVTVVGGQGSTNLLNVNGALTASTLTKSGGGILGLNSTTNAFSSNLIAINAGTLAVLSLSRLGIANASTSSIVLHGLGPNSGNGIVYTNLASSPETLNVPLTLASGHGYVGIGNGGRLTLAGQISGPGGLGLQAKTVVSSELTLANTANNFTGGVVMAGTVASTIQFAGDGNLGAAAGPVVFGSSDALTLKLLGTWTTTRQIAFGGALGSATAGGYNTNGFDSTWGGAITGTSNLFKIDSGGAAGVWTITSADNPYSGTISLGSTTIKGGTLALAGAGSLNSASIAFGQSGGPAGTYVLNLAGATDADSLDGSPTPWRLFAALNTTSGFTQAHTVQLGSTAGAPVDLRVGSGTFGGTAGTIAGFGKLVVAGSGLTLNGSLANTFTGGIEIWSGTLTINNEAQLGNAANGVSLLGGTLATSAALSASHALTLGATPVPLVDGAGSAVSLINAVNGTGTISIDGPIGGAGGIRFSGSGTVTLGNGANAYLGDTQVANGTVAITASGNLGAAGNRLRLSGGTLLNNSAAAITLARPLILQGSATLSGGSAAASFAVTGPVLAASSSTLTKISANTLTLGNDNRSFFGVLAIGNGSASGTVALSSTGHLRRGTVTMGAAAAATLDLSGLTRELNSLGSATANSFAAGNTVALGAGGSLTVGFANVAMSWLGNVTGDNSASVTKVGTGSLALQSSGQTFGGGLHLLSGSATLADAGTLPAQSTLTVGGWGDGSNAGGKLTLDNTATSASRLDALQAIHSNAGELGFTTNGTVASNQTTGSLRGAGMTTVTMTTGGTLSFTDASNALTRLDRGTFLIRAGNANLGASVATTALANVTFANNVAGQLVGGGGAAGSTTISILPYAAGGVTTSDGGSTFMTYGANGMRPLSIANEYATNLATAAATDNVMLTGGATAAGTATVNSLVLGAGGTVGGSGVLTLTSGALLNVAGNVFGVGAISGTPLGVALAELRAGPANAAELIVTAAGDLGLSAKLTTSGGLTKSGGAALYLTNAANTYTGQTTINAGLLVIDDKAALGGSSSLAIGGGFLKYRGPDSTLTGTTVKAAGGAAAGLGSSAGFHVASGTTLTLAGGSVSGNGGILKDGSGVLRITGANTNSGATIIGGGALVIDSPAALGTNPRVIFGTGLSAAGGQTLRFAAPMTLTQDFITNTSDAGVGFGFDTNGQAVTLSGTILSTASTRGLYKLGAGELTLTAMQMYTGATQVYAGTLRLSGDNGSIVNAAGTNAFGATASIHLGPGAMLLLDNAAANNNNRLPDVWDTPFGSGDGAAGRIFMSGGELKIIGHAAGTTERMNQFSIVTGTITLSGAGTQLVSGRVLRQTAQTAVLIRGTNLGGTPGPTSTNWLAVDLGSGSTQLGGAGGAKGTPFINIVPGFMGDVNASGVGTDLVTYAFDTGFRLLTAGEYATAIPARISDLTRAPNVSLSGSATVNETTAVTALKLAAGAVVNGGGTLQFGQSTVLATGNSSIAVPMLNSHIAGTNGGFDFLVAGNGTTLTVSSAIASGPIVKFGGGTLLLDGRYVKDQPLTIAQGTVQLGANGGLPLTGATVTVQAGATLDLGGQDRTISAVTRSFNIGTSIAAGQVAEDGTISLGANRLTLYDGGTFLFSGAITGSGGLSKGLLSSGTSSFTRPLSYTGSTRLYAGELDLRGAATPSSTQLELRGGSLTFTNSDDNAFAGGYVPDRVAANVPITLAGGTITFVENANAIANHQLGPLNLTGGGKLTITQTSVTAPSTTTIANLNRTTGTLTFTATNLGLAQAANGNARILATLINGSSPSGSLTGGGGAPGTTTVDILPWAWSTDASGFVTYESNGFRPLASSEYATTITSGTSTSNNVKLAAGASLGSATTINSLNTGFDVSGVGLLTIASGALAATSTNTVNHDPSLRAGSGDTRELVLNVANSAGTLRINGAITTSGGVTKTGPGILNLAGANTFSGGLNVDEGQVVYTSDAQLGSASNAITFGGNAVALTARGLQFNGAPSGTTAALNRNFILNGYGAIGATNNAVLQINGTITGPGALGLSVSSALSSIFELNGGNTFTGDLVLNRGVVSIANDAVLGGGSVLVLSPGNAKEGVFLRGDWTSTRNIHVAAAANLNTNGRNATLSGQFFGSDAFTKTNAGTLILTQPMSYAGLLTIDAGELRLKDRGSLAANANGATVNPNASLVLDDTGVHFSDRIHDTAAAFNLNAANLTLLGSASATTEEVLGVFTMATGPSMVSILPGSGQAAILRLTGTVTNTAAAATLFRGNNLGVNAPGAANSANLLFTNAASQSQSFPLTGGGAPAGHPSISIVKGGFGDITDSGLGSQLVTYEQDKGIRLLTAAEYTGTLIEGSIVTDNIQLTSSKTLTLATTANALWLNGGGGTSSAGTLTLTAATILVTGVNNSIGSPLAAGSNALAIGGPGELTIGSGITGSGGLVKMGGGTLTLGVATSYSGNTWLRSGSLNLAHANALGSSTLRFVDGTLSNSSAGPLTVANSGQVDGTLRIGGTRDLTLSGSIFLNNATREFNITNTGVTTLSGSIDGTADLAGVGLIKTGPGLLVLTSANLYGDTSGTNRFYETYTDVNGGELRADNLTGSAAGGSQVRVNLSGTLGGTGRVGSLATHGGTLAPGDAGVGTLSTGDLNFGGGTFSLELAGAASADALSVTGAVAFSANTELTLSLLGGYTPTLNDQWTIVTNDASDPVNLGAFRFTAGGAPLNPGVPFNLAGSTFFLDYAGGSGNDVVLTAVPEPAASALLAGAASLIALARRRSRRMC